MAKRQRSRRGRTYPSRSKSAEMAVRGLFAATIASPTPAGVATNRLVNGRTVEKAVPTNVPVGGVLL